MNGILNRLRGNWQRGENAAFRLAACFLFEAVASAFPYSIGTAHGMAPLVWVANGVLLAWLLLEPRSRWLATAGVGFAAQVTAGALISGHFGAAELLASALNVGEAVGCAFLLRRRWSELRRFVEKNFLLPFVGFAVLAAPFASGLLFAWISTRDGRASLWTVWLTWAVAHGLGSAIATPAVLALLRVRLREAAGRYKEWLLPALPVLVTIAAFSQPRAALLFLVLPLIVLIFVRLSLEWSAFVLFVVTETAVLFTAHGAGPLAMVAAREAVDPAVLVQLFLAEGVFILYSISAAFEYHRLSEDQLQKIAELHSLVSDNSRDAIILADPSGRRSFGSAAAKNIGGWKPEELLSGEGLARVHPDDRARVESIIDELRQGAAGAMMECRIRREDESDYLWVEASLHMLRDPQSGESRGILNFVRDISVRKVAEIKLQDAYEAVEALSVTDPLTGLANRRRFEKVIALEWRRAARSKEPLSLLMVDVDNFKKYNDSYGHPRGDSCLKQVAEAAMDSVMRPGDLVARFGGEEFVVVLANTDNAGAMHVGRQLCMAMQNRHLQHRGNPPGIVTISIGCATLVPQHDLKVADLVEMADQALYQAKRNGRNQVYNGTAEAQPEGREVVSMAP